MTTRREFLVIWFSLLVLTVGLGAFPQTDRMTWFLESLPVMLALVILALTRSPFPLTRITYRVVWLFAVILLVGGHYSYAEMPLFDLLQSTFDLSRNYYDRLGHVFQGVTAAVVGRELLLRLSPLHRGGWLFFLVCCVALAVSAFYELIEWWVAVASGEAATAFLATQGDVWDTQWDMFLALAGALVVQLAVNHAQDRQLREIDATLLFRK